MLDFENVRFESRELAAQAMAIFPGYAFFDAIFKKRSVDCQPAYSPDAFLFDVGDCIYVGDNLFQIHNAPNRGRASAPLVIGVYQPGKKTVWEHAQEIHTTQGAFVTYLFFNEAAEIFEDGNA